MEENKIVDVNSEDIKEVDVNPSTSTDSKISLKDIHDSLKQCREVCKQYEMIYNQLRDEFKFDYTQMNKIKVINNNWLLEHYPDTTDISTLSEDEKYGGIRNLSIEEIIEIFGKDSPIVVEDFVDISRDRICSCYETFISLVEISEEFNKLNNEYAILMNEAQKQQIEILKEAVKNEKDPGKIAILNKAIQDYEDGTTLKWLSEKLSEKKIERIKSVSTDESKLKYITEKAINKLQTLNIDKKFLLEINGFEKRHLDEKYHKNDGILAIYLINELSYVDIYEKKNKLRFTVTMMMLDNYIRNTIDDEMKEKILNNIIEFENQLL